MIRYYDINGRRLLREEALIGIEDLGLLRGFGVFDFFRVSQGRGVFIEDYLVRFERSAGLLGLELPVSLSALRARIEGLITANGMEEAAIQLVLTGGYSPDNYTPADPNLLILEREPPSYGPSYYERGIKLLLHEHQREVPEVKTTNYLTGIRLLPALREAGALEPLYFADGWVRETVRSNVFVVTADGRIATPGSGVLAGITRSKVLQLARARFEQVEERDIRLEELKDAREVFLSSTTKRIMPVTQIDHHVVGDGRPGEVCRILAEAFAAYEAAYLSGAVSGSTLPK